MEDKLYKLRKFISDYWSYKIDKLTIDTSLDNIGMYGDDKYDFIIDFAKEFNVDISAINFDEYVEPEPTVGTQIRNFYSFLFKKKSNLKLDKKSITIKQLLEIINKGKWTD